MGERMTANYHVRLLILASSHITISADSFEEAAREAEKMIRNQPARLRADVLAVHTDYVEEAS